MSVFDLGISLERARRRLGRTARASTRAPRSDRGRSRLDPRVLAEFSRLLRGQERPRMRVLLRSLRACCQRAGVDVPSRATAYKLLATLPCPRLRKRDLPVAAQEALYNLAPESEVPTHQVAFYCFNYGDLEAVSFAAGLPWLALYQARRLPGHRPRSRGLLEAAAKVRGI